MKSVCSFIFAVMIYVALYSGANVQAQPGDTEDTGQTQTIALNRPEGLAFDAKDNLYVADTGNNRILVFAPDLTLSREFGSEGTGEGQFKNPHTTAKTSNVCRRAKGHSCLA